MKSSDSRRKPDADILSATVEWVLEQKEGFGPGRAEAFRAWCDADPRHALAVAKAERTVAMLGELAELKAPLAARLAEDGETEAAPRRRIWLRVAAWTMGAAAALAIGWWQWPAGSSPEFNYVSNASHPQQVALEDGSFVDLNANTVIRAHMLPHERRVSLREGEAHFAVAHDTSRPFIVEAGGVSIRAVGTAFNVRLGAKGVEVLVLEGRVEISGAMNREREKNEAHPQLAASERAVVPRGRSSSEWVVEKVDPAVLSRAVAWHSSVTTISSRPLRDIVDLFNRRNQMRLVIADPELGDRSLGGSFSIEQPQAFVRLLELDGDVVSEQHGENEIVLRRKR